MEVTEIFKDALTYSTKDWNKLLILGVLFLIMGIFEVLGKFGFQIANNVGAQIGLILTGLIALFFTLLINGYGLSITRDTIGLQEEIPEFDWVKNLIDGIKLLILEIVYYIIPLIVVVIVAYATGAFSYIVEIINYVITYGATNIPQSIILEAAVSFLLVFLVGGIFYIIFTLLYYIATAILAETDSLVEAINIIEVFNKIGEIGLANYLIWAVLLVIISFVIGIIGGIIQIIPLIGLIIVMLVIYPFIKILSSRALGLIYNEAR